MPLYPVNTFHYIRYRLGLDPAATQMTEAERVLLRQLAPGRKKIVELGTFEGVSALIMREAMDADAELCCIDPFPIGRIPFSIQLAISKREIRRSKNGRVRILRLYSYEAIRGWDKMIDLLYMSGDHSFEGACRDFSDWGKFLKPGGLILIQTCHSCPAKPVADHVGPRRLVEQVVSNDPAFKINCYVDTIAVVEKKSLKVVDVSTSLGSL
jgi:hypothetical protein